MSGGRQITQVSLDACNRDLCLEFVSSYVSNMFSLPPSLSQVSKMFVLALVFSPSWCSVTLLSLTLPLFLFQCLISDNYSYFASPFSPVFLALLHSCSPP